MQECTKYQHVIVIIKGKGIHALYMYIHILYRLSVDTFERVIKALHCA